MKFFTFTILALVAVSRGQVQTKRGAVAQQYSAQAPAAAIAYTKVQQPVQKVVAAPQPQFYSQAAAPSAYSFPVQQQYQYQPQAQAVAYAQPTLTKYAAAPAPAPGLAKVAAYRQPFSLANDVSSFQYSSPVVTYNSLGLLSQVVGKVATQPVQAKAVAAPAAPSPAVYQSQLQSAAPVQYSAAPVPQKYTLSAAQPAQRFVSAAPQQYLSQLPQQYVSSQTQAYQAAPSSQAYSAQTAQAYNAQAAQAYNAQAQASQTYTAQAAQSIPQSLYAQAPQYYSAQQLKQVNLGESQ